MIAIGTGLFAGLSSFTHWRIISNEESLRLTNMYDVRARLGEDAFLPQGALAAIARGIDGVDAVEERLISDTQAEVDTADGPVLVRARIIGVDMTGGGPDVNGVEVIAGRGIGEAEFGEPVVLIERNFGVYYGLPEQGEFRLGGNVSTTYVGQAVSPEYFIVVEEGSFIGQANLVAVFAPLETAQELSGRTGLVNDLVLTAEPGADLSGDRDCAAGPDVGAPPGNAAHADAPGGRCLVPGAHAGPGGRPAGLQRDCAGAVWGRGVRGAELRRPNGRDAAAGDRHVDGAWRQPRGHCAAARAGGGADRSPGRGVRRRHWTAGWTAHVRRDRVVPFPARIPHAVSDRNLPPRCRHRLLPADTCRAVARLPRHPRPARGGHQDRAPGGTRGRAGTRHQPHPPSRQQPGPHALPQPAEGAPADAADAAGPHRGLCHPLWNRRDSGLVPCDAGRGRPGAGARSARPAQRTARLLLSRRFARGGQHRQRRRARRGGARPDDRGGGAAARRDRPVRASR